MNNKKKLAGLGEEAVVQQIAKCKYCNFARYPNI
jgi:hypothetical protein